MLRRVNLSEQFVKYEDEVRAAISRVLGSGRYTLGPEVEAFEQEFAAYLGIEHVVGVADGTRAITMALSVLDVGPGDEVITTVFTAVPTINAIIETGATPVLVDIDLETYLIDLDAVAAAVSARTKAVVPVHMFGNVVDIPKLRATLPPDIRIVEDSAQAHGSRFAEKMAGSLGDLSTFSFYPTKNLGAYGDGGAIATDDPGFAARLRLIRNHGMENKDVCSVAGLNSRLDELQAAILRVKLPHLEDMNRARRDLVGRYLERLPRHLFEDQRVQSNVVCNRHVFQPRYLGDRAALIEHLDSRGIQSNVYYEIPHHLQPGYRHLGYAEGDLPVVERLCRQGIALPLYPELGAARVDLVIEAIAEHLAETREDAQSA